MSGIMIESNSLTPEAAKQVIELMDTNNIRASDAANYLHLREMVDRIARESDVVVAGNEESKL